MALVNKVLIVGGGIGGMCAAIQCAKQGIAVDLVELNPDWTVYGAGITVSGPSLRALRDIGVLDEVLARGGHWTHMDICAADGTVLNVLPVPHSQDADDLPPAGGVLRPVLAEILGRATRAAGVDIRLGLTFEELTQDAGGVDVRFTDGSRGRYDLVVGADGINSKVRGVILPDAPAPQFSGQGSWRAIVPRTRANSTIFMGKTTKAGLNPVSETQCYLFTLDQRDGCEFIPADQWPQQLAGLLAEFGGAIADIRQDLLDGGAIGKTIVYRPLMGHLLPPPWHKGRVVLLGDAIHATTPHLASGAGIAIEGALILAEELGRRHYLDGALAAYAGRHYDRARLVVHSSLRMGELERNGGSREEHMALMIKANEALRARI